MNLENCYIFFKEGFDILMLSSKSYCFYILQYTWYTLTLAWLIVVMTSRLPRDVVREGERERDSLCAMKSVRKICKTFYKCWSSMRVQLCSILTHTHIYIYGCGQSNKVDMHNLG